MPARLTPEALRAALPDLESEQRLDGLEGRVTIYRDRWGIPHIRAECEADLFLAQGFATAQDRLWHMDFDRHQALGRWAEFAGPAGLERDRLLRAAGMGRTARLDYAAASPEARAMVDAYAAGVNAFLKGTAALPVEYALLEQQPEPWESWHCLAVYKMRNSLLGTFEPKLFRARLLRAIGPEKTARLIRGYPQGCLLTVPPGALYDGPEIDGLEDLSRAAVEANWLDEVNPGSNAWSISGRLTASGLPLVGGDSHRGLDVPSVYYQVHLACPEFAVIGHSVPGMPGALHFCHNEYVAWGMTYGAADTQDLFIERFREVPDGREYEFEGRWRPAQVLPETISVRGADAIETEVTITHHGPVVAGEPAAGCGVAISDPGLIEATPWLDAARDAMRSRSVEELRQAFGKWTDRVNNHAVADVHGSFGYLHVGRIPIRGEANGWTPVPGWSGEYEWAGYIPHGELPRAINPETGYAVTCNQRVAGPDYPYYVGLYFNSDHRARRVRQHLIELAPGTATVDDMARIHADRISIPAQALTRALAEIESWDERSARALALLREWDGSIDRERVEPTIYASVRACLVRRIAADWLGSMAEEALARAAGGDAHVRLLALEVDRALARGDVSVLPPGYNDWQEALTDALREALADLTAELGEELQSWQWGRVHHTRPQHPLSSVFPEAARHLDPPGLATHGDGDTPLAGSFGLGGPFVGNGVSVNRYIFDPSDWSRSRWIVPLGASGHPASPHWADQARAWADVEYIPQLWDWDQIATEAKSRQELRPAGD